MIFSHGKFVLAPKVCGVLARMEINMLEGLIYVCPLLFLAGFVDSIAGGGGLISMPAYMMTGMPMHMAYGCNKLQSALGTTFAAGEFIKNKLVDFRTAVVAAVFALIGSAAATRIVFYLPDEVLSKMLLVILPVVAVLVILKGFLKNEDKEKSEFSTLDYSKSGVLGLLIGLYDGLFGPGGGMLAIFLFMMVLKYDLRTSSGNAKFVILISNYVALLFYIRSGSIMYEIAIPATIFNMAGNYVGSKCAIHKGQKLIRPAMSIVAFLLIIKTVVGFL